MRRRILATALLLALTVTLCPAALAAGKLSTPTELEWGVGHYWNGNTFSAEPDTISWNVGTNTMGWIRLIVYKDSKKLLEEYSHYRDPSGKYLSRSLSHLLPWYDIPLESGTYYFTVQNLTDYNSTSPNNSAVATSPKWTYTAPAAKLAAPTKPVWDFPYLKWQGKADPAQWGGATALIYYSKTKNGTYDIVGNSGAYSYYAEQSPIDEYALEEYGPGYYKFRVRIDSRDITQWQNSDWSAFSEPYYYDGSPVDICYHENTSFQNEALATCAEDGYTGDYVCLDCGEVLEKGEVIPATGHVVDSYTGCCMVCGTQLEYYGTMGNGSLSWTYSIETNALTLADPLPAGNTVYAACFKNGRFVGAKALTAAQGSVTLRSDLDEVRLIWLDGNQVPQCQAANVPLE